MCWSMGKQPVGTQLAGDVISILKVTWMVRIEKWVVAW